MWEEGVKGLPGRGSDDNACTHRALSRTHYNTLGRAPVSQAPWFWNSAKPSFGFAGSDNCNCCDTQNFYSVPQGCHFNFWHPLWLDRSPSSRRSSTANENILRRILQGSVFNILAGEERKEFYLDFHMGPCLWGRCLWKLHTDWFRLCATVFKGPACLGAPLLGSLLVSVDLCAVPGEGWLSFLTFGFT